ncbi:MAG TPA: trehalose-phosphatase [Acidimicrobiales bacterium]|nr:trehalose-phosphatase [Acidimicrobiales bacterium]
MIVTDFDGTLAPIVDDPQRARPLPGAPDLLAALAARFRTVAVVSGRPARFLAERLELDERPSRLVVFGLYGLERADPGGVGMHAEDLARWRDALARASAAARRQLPVDVLVEDKGLGLTLHWRRAPGARRRVLEVAEALARDAGLALREAKAAIELGPPGAPGKGDVVGRLVAGATGACVLGDDLGDLAAFDALDAVAAAGGWTCKVAVAGPEAPPALLEAADLRLDGPPAALAFLRAVLEAAGGA